MKKLIIGMIAALTAITGYSATDDELRAMLDAKDYTNFVVESTSTQLTNLATKVDAYTICDIAYGTNMAYKCKAMFNAKLIDINTLTEIGLKHKNINVLYLADSIKDAELVYNISKQLIDVPNSSIHIAKIFKHGYINQFKFNDIELSKSIAEKLLIENPSSYIAFVFSDIWNKKYNVSDEYKSWAEECLKNMNEKTLNIDGWCHLVTYNKELLKSKNSYYIGIFSNLSYNNIKWVISLLSKSVYFDEAIEDIANTIKSSKHAYLFAREVDTYRNNKEMIKRLYPVISKDNYFAYRAACDLNDVDKVIDIVMNANTELTAKQLNDFIPIINSADVDYRSAEVIKALRNINSRYTLRLYNERETWEPILSKIRAMIDVRQ